MRRWTTLLEPGNPFNPMIDAVSTYYSGAELAKVSVHDLAAYEDLGVNWRVREGYGAVVADLAATAPVRYRCPVRAIDHSGRRLVLETDLGAVRCRAVIVTLSTGVLARAPDLFRPALPDKTEAAENLPLGLADKVYFRLDDAEAFEPDSRAFGKVDARATAAYHLRPLGRPIVEAYFGGELAEGLEPGGMEAAAAFAADELAGLFGAGVSQVDAALVLSRLAHRPLGRRGLFLRASRFPGMPRQTCRARGRADLLRRRSVFACELFDRTWRI